MTNRTFNLLDQKIEGLSEVLLCFVISLASLNGIAALGFLPMIAG